MAICLWLVQSYIKKKQNQNQIKAGEGQGTGQSRMCPIQCPFLPPHLEINKSWLENAVSRDKHWAQEKPKKDSNTIPLPVFRWLRKWFLKQNGFPFRLIYTSKNPRPLKPHRKALKKMVCCETREKKPGSCCCKWENSGNCLIMLSILILEPVRILPLLALLRGFSRALFCWLAVFFHLWA